MIYNNEKTKETQVFLATTPPQFPYTVLEKVGGSMTKTLSYKNGTFSKSADECFLSKGHATTHTATLADLKKVIKDLKSNQALCLGISQNKSARVVSKKKYNGQAGTITRSQEHFSFPEGPGFAFFDIDSAPGEAPLTSQQVLSILASVFPDIADMGYMVSHSTSSHVYTKEGKEIRGASGLHIYFQAKDAQDLPRFNKALFKRLWIAGHGNIHISSAGSQLERTVYDAAVFSPERIIFEAPPLLKDGLTQSRPEPFWHSGGGLDTSLLKDLSPQEESDYNNAVALAKKKTARKAGAIRKEYRGKEIKKLGHTQRMSKKKARRTVEARLSGTLIESEILHFDSLGEVTVKAVLNNPMKYDRQTLRDPIEPEKGPQKAIFYANIESEKPRIFSHVHGGVKYKLIRTSRLLFSNPQNRVSIKRWMTELSPEALGLNHHRVNLVCSPTNSGKTNFMLWYGMQQPTLILCPCTVNVDNLKNKTVHMLDGSKRDTSDHYSFLHGKEKAIEHESIIAVYDQAVPLILEHEAGTRDLSEITLCIDEIQNLFKSANTAFRNKVMKVLLRAIKRNYFKKVVGFSGTYGAVEQSFLDVGFDNAVTVTCKNKPKMNVHTIRTGNRNSAIIEYVVKHTDKGIIVIYINNKKDADILGKQMGVRYQALNADTKHSDENRELLETDRIADGVKVLFVTSIGLEGINLKNDNIHSIHYLESKFSSLDFTQLANRGRVGNHLNILWRSHSDPSQYPEHIDIEEYKKEIRSTGKTMMDGVNAELRDRPEALKTRLESMYRVNKGWMKICLTLNHDVTKADFNYCAISEHLYQKEIRNEKNEFYAEDKLRYFGFSEFSEEVLEPEQDLTLSIKRTRKELKEQRQENREQIIDKISALPLPDIEGKLEEVKQSLQKGSDSKLEEEQLQRWISLETKGVKRNAIPEILKKDKYRKAKDGIALYTAKTPVGCMFEVLLMQMIQARLSDRYTQAAREEMIFKTNKLCKLLGCQSYKVGCYWDKNAKRWKISGQESKRIFESVAQFSKKTEYVPCPNGGRAKEVNVLVLEDLNPIWFEMVGDVYGGVLECNIHKEILKLKTPPYEKIELTHHDKGIIQGGEHRKNKSKYPLDTRNLMKVSGL